VIRGNSRWLVPRSGLPSTAVQISWSSACRLARDLFRPFRRTKPAKERHARLIGLGLRSLGMMLLLCGARPTDQPRAIAARGMNLP
jgi:hypothetical protein